MGSYKTTKFSNNEIETTEYKHIPIKIRIRFNPLLLIIVVSLGLGINFYFTNYLASTGGIESDPPSASTSTNIVPDYLSSEGFLFPDSSTSRLSTSEIRNLRDVAAANGESYRNLLRYAVNEIYARHGYLFDSGQRFDTFYSQFDWYRALPKQTTVSWASFNETERYNLGLLLSEEELNGYR